MEEIIQFLTGNGAFYIATMDGDSPRVRPFGFAMIYEGRLYFCTGGKKKVCRQLEANPHTEMSAMNTAGEWVRVSGEAVFDNDMGAKQAAFQAMPGLANIYQSPENPEFKVFYLSSPQATVYSMTAAPRSVDL